MRLTKMHGLGNDYIYLDCTKTLPEDLPRLAVRLSDRHFGVGGDGLICALPSQRADFRMRIFNADGSEGEMCGNGIRCLGKFLYDRGLTDQKTLRIETLAGVKTVELLESGGQITGARVDMGKPLVFPKMTIDVQGKYLTVYPASMGNPHAVLFVHEPDEIPLKELGSAIECAPPFPQRTNVEFVHVEREDRLRLRVWERGSGETLACGTGACAALAVAVKHGMCARKAEVQLPGGVLALEWDGETDSMRMTGPAVQVFECEIEA